LPQLANIVQRILLSVADADTAFAELLHKGSVGGLSKPDGMHYPPGFNPDLFEL